MKKLGFYVLWAAAATFFTGTAGATVVFNWQQLSSSPTIGSSSGQLKITDATYQSGHLEFLNSDEMGTYGFPAGPLVSFSFGNDTASPVGLAWDHYRGDFEFSLVITNDGFLSGSINANNTETDVRMSASSGIWNIDRFGSDNPDTGCFLEPGCSGATGAWVLDPRSVPVPEPGPLSLFGLGLFGIGLAATSRKGRVRGQDRYNG